MSFINTRDVAAVALAALQGDGHKGRIHDLTGSEAFSYEDVAGRLTTLLDRPIMYVALSDDAYQDALEWAGLSAWYARGLADLYRFRVDEAAIVTDVARQMTGQAARTLDTYLTEHRAAFAWTSKFLGSSHGYELPRS